MDDIKTLSDEALAALRTEKKTELQTLAAVDAPSRDQRTEALACAEAIDGIDAELATRAKEAADFAALSTRKFAGDEEPEPEKAEPEAKQEPAKEPEKAEPEAKESEKSEPSEPAEPAAAEGGEPVAAKSSTVAELASQSKRPETPVNQAKPLAITAAADVPEFASGQRMTTLEEVGRGVIGRARGFSTPDGDGKSTDLRKFGTAMFGLDFPEELVVDKWEEAQDVFHKASDESRLPNGSLVAAGGWCSPSETVYDLSQDATTEGMLSLPEVAVKRGGIRYAQSPVFADFYANPGFKQTEAQAISGTTKVCVEVTCPSFVDKRLDVNGVCIKVPILTNAAYPEVVGNFVAGTLVAHQHWINADVIGQIVTFAGAARVFAAPDSGSTTSDTLEALELVIMQRRQKYRLSFNQSMEVLVPFWVKGAVRADIGRRTGRGSGAVSDAEINAWFASIRANVQWLYDWQAIDETAEVYPATFQALVYPAGTFVKGTADVINLSTVYDAASLAVNTYTGLFSEQGLLVAKMKFGVDLLTLPICNQGAMGALDQTCLPAA